MGADNSVRANAFATNPALVSGAIALLCFIGAGLSIGLLAWGRGDDVERLLWLALLPFVAGFAERRLSIAMLLLGYFLGGARGLPGGAAVFFGEQAPQWFGLSLWLVASAVLTAPFVGLWSKGVYQQYSFSAAICVLMIPPLGLIGWLNPIALAGALYPGTGWGGVMLTLWLFVALMKRRPVAILAAAVIALCFNYIAPSNIVPPQYWKGVDTSFARLSSAGSDDAQQLLASMRRVDWVIAFAKDLPPKSVTVLPETILGSFNGLTEYALADIDASLSAKGARLIVGAEIPLEGGQYRNSLAVLGASDGEARFISQKIPVPISMWRPWTSTGAVASVFGPQNILKIGDKRAGVAICYEQLLPYTLLSVIGGARPDAIIAVSNVWWARATSIPNIQRQTTSAFARLFGIGIIFAFNI